jgi:hypothetical protein
MCDILASVSRRKAAGFLGGATGFYQTRPNGSGKKSGQVEVAASA